MEGREYVMKGWGTKPELDNSFLLLPVLAHQVTALVLQLPFNTLQ